jgi:hypothetical protein
LPRQQSKKAKAQPEPEPEPAKPSRSASEAYAAKHARSLIENTIYMEGYTGDKYVEHADGSHIRLWVKGDDTLLVLREALGKALDPEAQLVVVYRVLGTSDDLESLTARIKNKR